VPQRHHRVNFRRAPCRSPTGQQRNQRQQRGDEGKAATPARSLPLKTINNWGLKNENEIEAFCLDFFST
jgi:hypothetical protein